MMFEPRSVARRSKRQRKKSADSLIAWQLKSKGSFFPPSVPPFDLSISIFHHRAKSLALPEKKQDYECSKWRCASTSASGRLAATSGMALGSKAAFPVFGTKLAPSVFSGPGWLKISRLKVLLQASGRLVSYKALLHRCCPYYSGLFRLLLFFLPNSGKQIPSSEVKK